MKTANKRDIFGTPAMIAYMSKIEAKYAKPTAESADTLENLLGDSTIPPNYWRDTCAEYARRLNKMEPERDALKARIAKLETALLGPLNRAQFGVKLTLTDSEIESAREALKGDK